MQEVVELSENSPEQLVVLIQQGHAMYFEELFYRFLPLVKKFNKVYYLRSLEQEDFWQEARMVLHKAVQAYAPEKGLQFASFYKLTLKHHIFSLIRKESAVKRKIDKGSVSLDEILENQYSNHTEFSFEGVASTRFSPEEIVMVKESASGYFESLSEFEQAVFVRFLKGSAFSAIAEEFDCDVTSIKNAYDRCHRKMRRLLE
ncbi:sigma-70 family RNA polymerase sigma factor [Trichococcus ilyis]|jgi:RNA polymerase sporulation-specific sigma factor|uniref:RNA polymerase sporulation-specific sigma factor n=1 Tax=Trichococcus ilyis TaxID=640938 RepID=A0A143YQ30_9LACT|nr:sigma-70 family RNA polymerase sigma factor [Trichococcus ilyis]CZQ96281.1 rna polymerase sigma-70 region 2 [Trichococcus ilyis]SEJ79243.1 RNA polymerase sporulation-specific sigma factor [Trichococcus ilyis]